MIARWSAEGGRAWSQWNFFQPISGFSALPAQPWTFFLLLITFYLRVNNCLTILSLNGAYCYFFVTEKTGRESETTTRRVTYSPGTIYFPKLSGLQRSYELIIRDVSSRQEKCKMSLSIYSILIGKCVECIIITAVTHCGPQAKTTRNFAIMQNVFVR